MADKSAIQRTKDVLRARRITSNVFEDLYRKAKVEEDMAKKSMDEQSAVKIPFSKNEKDRGIVLAEADDPQISNQKALRFGQVSKTY